MNTMQSLNHFLDKAGKLKAQSSQFNAAATEIEKAVSVLRFYNDDDNYGSPPAAKVVVAPIAKVVPAKGQSKLKDSDMISVLTTSYQSPLDIVASLAAIGVKVSKPLIYQRMPALADSLPDLIEADGKAWRIKSNSAATPTKPKMASKAIATKPKVRKAPAKKSNPYAAAVSAMQSVLTNEWKSVATLVSQARRYGWKGDANLAARALDGLVRSGLADENGNRSYRRA